VRDLLLTCDHYVGSVRMSTDQSKSAVHSFWVGK